MSNNQTATSNLAWIATLLETHAEDQAYFALREVAAALNLVSESFDDGGSFGGDEGNWRAFRTIQMCRRRAAEAIAMIEGGGVQS